MKDTKVVVTLNTVIESFPISLEWDGKEIDCIETYYINVTNPYMFNWSLGTFEDELLECVDQFSLGLNFMTVEVDYEKIEEAEFYTGKPSTGGHSLSVKKLANPELLEQE